MPQAAQRPSTQRVVAPLSLQEFLQWDDGSDQLYELIEGEPVPMSEPTADHEDVADDICDLLKSHCQTHNLPLIPKRSKLIATGSRNGKDTARRGDIVIFEQTEWQRMKGLSSSAMAYSAPPVVIEVVSTNWRDDYLTKLAEYEAIGIQEYWIVDYAALGGMRYIGHPKQPTVSIFSMTPGQDEYGLPQQFHGDEPIQSSVLTGLVLTANRLWQSR